jgi:prepilin-type N-terminal cleavage/methylation domain-containing protein
MRFKEQNSKFKIQNSSCGFTLIELMVVISIMVILATTLIINLAGQRSSRDVRIAENQLVTNIRKVQSYTLSARSLPGGQDVQYYVLKFNLSTPDRYTIQAVYNVNASPQMQDIETVLLPPNIIIASTTANTSAISISRSLNPTTQTLQSSPLCALIAFAAPFGKVIFNDGCSPASGYPVPYTLGLPDDYYAKIVNFEGNAACSGSYGTPSICTASTDSIMSITIRDTYNTVSKTVTINGITGSVSFN